MLFVFAIVNNQLLGFLKANRFGGESFWNAHKLAGVANVRTEATNRCHHIFALKLAKGARQLKEHQSLFEGDSLHTLVGMERCEAWLFAIFIGIAQLHGRAKASDFHRHRLASLGVVAQNAFAHLVLQAQTCHALDIGVEIVVEMSNRVGPLRNAFSHVVEVVFHISGEVVVDDFWEVFD